MVYFLQRAVENFRQRIVDTEKELILLREENQRVKAGWEGEKRRNRDIETRLVNAEAANGTLQRRVDAFCDAKQVLENEVSFRLIDKPIKCNWLTEAEKLFSARRKGDPAPRAEEEREKDG